MSTSRAKHHSEQLQSPLFRMPRELRDEIYEYYMLENDGNHYNSATRILFHQPPSVSPRQAVPLGLRITCRRTAELGASEDFGEDILSQTFGDALQHALVLVKNRNPAKFAELACRTFGTDICPMKYVANGIRQSNPFREGALSTVYHWQYAPWCMPNDAELSKLEALLCQPGDFNHQLPMTNQGVSAHSRQHTNDGSSLKQL
jgi:hypothetical protein